MKKLFLLLIICVQVFAQPPKYDRKKFKHWIDTDRDCRNRRAEVLKNRSTKPVSYRKSKRGLCTVRTGRWDDYYFPEVHTEARMVDIDHVVPLKNAWESGAHAWAPGERELFANDPENLVITNRSYNRQKGAQTPLTWAPINREYYCKYLARWIKIKRKYQLTIDKQVFLFLRDADCKEEE